MQNLCRYYYATFDLDVLLYGTRQVRPSARLYLRTISWQPWERASMLTVLQAWLRGVNKWSHRYIRRVTVNCLFNTAYARTMCSVWALSSEHYTSAWRVCYELVWCMLHSTSIIQERTLIQGNHDRVCPKYMDLSWSIDFGLSRYVKLTKHKTTVSRRSDLK